MSKLSNKHISLQPEKYWFFFLQVICLIVTLIYKNNSKNSHPEKQFWSVAEDKNCL